MGYTASIRSLLEAAKWAIWSRWPRLLPDTIRRQILELSPYRCDQIGQGEPMIVMRREVWDAGKIEEVPGAGYNVDGEDWIIRDWVRAHPDWRPAE